MHHGTCVTHVPWCMSGSLTCGDGENVPCIPGACAPAILRIWQEAHEGEVCGFSHTLQWRHNERGGVSNHQPHSYLLNRLFSRRLKKTSKLPSLAFVGGIHRWPVNSAHKGPVTRKMFPFDEVIMSSSLINVLPLSQLNGMHWCLVLLPQDLSLFNHPFS